MSEQPTWERVAALEAEIEQADAKIAALLAEVEQVIKARVQMEEKIRQIDGRAEIADIFRHFEKRD